MCMLPCFIIIERLETQCVNFVWFERERNKAISAHAGLFYVALASNVACFSFYFHSRGVNTFVIVDVKHFQCRKKQKQKKLRVNFVKISKPKFIFRFSHNRVYGADRWRWRHNSFFWRDLSHSLTSSCLDVEISYFTVVVTFFIDTKRQLLFYCVIIV